MSNCATKADIKNISHVDTSSFALKTNLASLKIEVELTELENKVPDVSSLATKTALTAAENKIPSVSSLVKKQTITQKLVSLQKKLLTIMMINILQLQSLIL